MEWIVPTLLALMIGFFCGDAWSLGMRGKAEADRDLWRQRAETATAMVDYFIGIAMDGSIHPHPHVCGQPGEGTYEECRECWLKAAADAVKEATDER